MAKKTLEWSGEEAALVSKNYQERISHGNLLFHMSVHKTIVPKNQKVILYCHWHEELEILFFTKGCARFQEDMDEYLVQQGEILLIKPNKMHTAYQVNQEDVEFYAILIHANFVASLVNDMVQQKYIAPLFSSKQEYPTHISAEMEKSLALLPLLNEIKDAYQLEFAGYELFIKARIFEVFYKLSMLTQAIKQDPQCESYKTIRMKIIIQYMQDNYSQKITLPVLAKKVSMSTGHFCRFFKDNLNLSPFEYLNSYRVSMAVHLMETTDKKLTEIAFDTGFNNVNYFTTVFKKVLHCTPTDYKHGLQHDADIKIKSIGRSL